MQLPAQSRAAEVMSGISGCPCGSSVSPQLKAAQPTSATCSALTMLSMVKLFFVYTSYFLDNSCFLFLVLSLSSLKEESGSFFSVTAL